MQIALTKTTIYVFEKTRVALETLASGAGTFEERLWKAHTSVLARLERDDAIGDFADDLKWVLAKCDQYIVPDRGMMPVSEIDRARFAEKLTAIVLKTGVRRDKA